MIDRDANYRILIQYTRNDGAVLGAPGDVRLFREWARILYGRFPDAESRMERDLLYYDGSSPARPQWFEQVTDSNLPVDGQYHVSAPVAGLPNARVAGDTANIEVDNSLPGQVLWDLTETGVTPGAYTSANVTVDEFGRVLAISNGGGGGGGDVVGPASATDNNVPQWDGTTGKLLKNGLGVSQGANGAADSQKLAQYTSTGKLQAGVDNGDGIQGISTNDDGVHGTSQFGSALYGNVTGAGAKVLRLTHAGGSGEFIRCWNGGADQQFVVDYNGAISWPNGGTGPTATLTNLGGTAVGTALFTVATPAGVRFIRVNADGTITLRTAAELLADIGAQASGSYLVTTNNLSDVANAAAARTNLGATSAGASMFTAADADAQRLLLGRILKKITTQTTGVSTSYTDVTDMSFSVVAGTTYSFTFVVLAESSSTSGGVCLAANGPAATYFAARYEGNQTAGGSIIRSDITAYDSSGTLADPNSVTAANTPCVFTLQGVIVPSANGTFSLRVKRGGSAGNIAVRAGSMDVIVM